MRTKLFIGGLIVAVICVIWIAATSNYNVQARNTALEEQTAQAVTSPQSGSLGLPAIQPTLPKTPSPRFTTVDVRTYLRTHPFMSGPLVKGATSTIVAIQFMTSKQASELMHGASVGLPDSALVCYVKLHGPFTQVNASVPPGAEQLPPAEFGVEIFDAETGNLLMWWTP
jgi:hypothetical protein